MFIAALAIAYKKCCLLFWASTVRGFCVHWAIGVICVWPLKLIELAARCNSCSMLGVGEAVGQCCSNKSFPCEALAVAHNELMKLVQRVCVGRIGLRWVGACKLIESGQQLICFVTKAVKLLPTWHTHTHPHTHTHTHARSSAQGSAKKNILTSFVLR